MPARPRFAYDCEGWDVGAIVEYRPIQLDNAQLSQAELGLKLVSLFGVAMYPRPSDLARLARGNFDRYKTILKLLPANGKYWDSRC